MHTSLRKIKFFGFSLTQAYLRSRYYDPRTGRFTSEDGARDGMNWYAYCGNNPVMFIDRTGLKPSLSAAAAMADHIYKDIPLSDNTSAEAQAVNRKARTVEGWRLIDYYTEGSLKIGAYIPEGDDWQNPSEYSLVFKGTTPTSGEDWENNAEQFFGVV